MKVRELIEQLKGLEQEKEVFILYDNSYLIEPNIQDFDGEDINEFSNLYEAKKQYVMIAG